MQTPAAPRLTTDHWPLTTLLWLLAAAADWSLIAAAVAAVAHDALWLPLAWLVIGNRQHALGVLMHEAAHGSIARCRWLNDWTARLLAAWPLGLPLEDYRAFHLAHHASLNEHDDPEQAFKREHPAYFPPRSKWRIAGDLIDDLLFVNVGEVLTFQRLVLLDGNPELLAVIFYWLQAAFVSTLIGYWWIVPLWAASFVTVAWAHNRLRIWLEHSGAPAVPTHSIRLPWLLDLVLRPHRVGLHAEHHRHPKTPWWRLARNL